MCGFVIALIRLFLYELEKWREGRCPSPNSALECCSDGKPERNASSGMRLMSCVQMGNQFTTRCRLAPVLRDLHQRVTRRDKEVEKKPTCASNTSSWVSAHERLLIRLPNVDIALGAILRSREVGLFAGEGSFVWIRSCVSRTSPSRWTRDRRTRLACVLPGVPGRPRAY